MREAVIIALACFLLLIMAAALIVQCNDALLPAALRIIPSLSRA
jgi:hypothetical protein